MSECVQLADLEEAIGCADIDNVGGIKMKFQIGFADDVRSWPSLPEPSGGSSLSLLQAGQWDGALEMGNAALLHTVYFTDETGVFTITMQGESGCESYLYQLDVSRAKMEATVFGLENALRGRKLVIIVEDKNGTKYLMGDAKCPARMVAADASTTGTAVTDKNNVPLRFQYSCPRKLVYVG